MNTNGLLKIAALIAFSALCLNPFQVSAEILCKAKKGGAIFSRPKCKKSEVAVGTLEVSSSSSSGSAGDTSGVTLSVTDSGAVSSGSDTNTGLDLNLTRSGATGGTLNNTGVSVTVVGDTGGDSTNVGLSVSASGADTNYCAIFQGGNVGIGVNDPDEQLEITGRIHMGQSSSPGVVTDKLYNVGGTLYWNGQELTLGTNSGGDITSVVAGSGLSGGGSSGAVTLSVNSGTSADQIVALNSSAELPTVSGANLTSLNASSISSGTLPDARLSSNISALGSSIGLTTEVTGILPVANGGTGASSLSNLLTLGTHTAGNYVASLSTSGGISGGSSGSEGAALALSIDQTFTPTWSGTHSFQSSANFGTTTASVEALHLNGRLHMEQVSAPATTTDKLYNVGGALFFNGQNLTTGAAGGDVTAVTAGTGLSGGGSTGDLSLAVDVGTAANKIVQLNSSAQLPAVSGVNLTNLNASNLASGTVADGRLSASVSLLGSAIALDSEVSGTLPVANGGTGASALTDLITLGTHTTGNFVAVVAAGSGISLSSSGAEGGTATLSLDQSVAPTWTAGHTFSGVATDITTVSNQDFCVVPNGTGKMGVGTTSPSAMIDVVSSVGSATAATDQGIEINLTDLGLVNSGTDTSVGVDVNVTRTGASGGTIDTRGLDVTVTADSGGTSTATGLNVAVSGADQNYAAIFTGGSVGIGTSTPGSALEISASSSSATAATERGSKIAFTDSGAVASSTDTTYGLELDLTRTGASGGTIDSTGMDIAVVGDSGGTSRTTGLSVSVSGADVNVSALFSGGHVGIGDTISVISSNLPGTSLSLGSGVLCVDNGGDNCDDALRTAGTIYANNTTVASVDLAEDFPIETNDSVEPAEIVMIDSHLGRKCVEFASGQSGSKVCARFEQGMLPFVSRATAQAPAKRILGVISSKPGITLGGFGQEELIEYSKVPVALVGRVPLKVNLENGPIELGDRITLSSVAGQGMRAAEGNHQVAIALEPYDQEALAAGVDRILVLVK